MEIDIYLENFSEEFTNKDNWEPNTIGSTIQHFFNEDSLKGINIAIIGVNEVRGFKSKDDIISATDQIRKQLYGLFNHFQKVNIIDLGNVKLGNSVKDTYYALSKITSDLIKKEITPLIIGGTQDLTYANYKAYEDLEQMVNIVTIDPKIDLGILDDDINDENYINHIIMHQPNYLFNFSSLGYQSYFTDNQHPVLMEKLFFDAYRLGSVRPNIEEVEPVLRNADILSFDLNAIKKSDAPGNNSNSPNGFTGEEACRITRYAGLSDKLSSFGIYNYNNSNDKNHITSMLISQMIWYFLEGYSARQFDYPVAPKTSYTKYHVNIPSENIDLNFYKSGKSGRWWIDVPFPGDVKTKYNRHLMMPCTYSDYLKSCEGEIPDRWWQTYQKLI